MSFKYPIQIRYFDIDMNHHVNNSVYFTYMENARTDLMMDDFLEYLNQGIQFVVAEASCKFRRPIRIKDSAVCELQFKQTGITHFTITYLFKHSSSGNIYAEGTTKMAMYDEIKNRPIPIPAKLIEKFMND